MQSQKWQNDLCSFPRQTVQYHSNPSLCPNLYSWKIWSWLTLWRLQDLLELTPEKDVLFIIEDWNEKVGRQEISGVTGKFGLGVQNEAGQRLTEFCWENTLVIANTLVQEHNRWLYTRISPDSQYQNQTDMFFAAKDGEALYSQKKQDLELTGTQIISSLLQNSGLNSRK